MSTATGVRRNGILVGLFAAATSVLVSVAQSAASGSADPLHRTRPENAGSSPLLAIAPATAAARRVAAPKPSLAKPTRTTTSGIARPAATGTAATPSGEAAPSGDVPGWRLKYVDDFGGNQLNYRWFKYVGTPGGDPGGWWANSHLVVGNGMLTLAGYRDSAYGGKFTTAGLSSHLLAQTYGKWLVRFLIASGQGISYAALLWPDTTSWPPEIDFAEDNGLAARRTVTASLHYATARTSRRVLRSSTDVSLTGWHTLGVEWLPGSITYTLDGQPWSRMTGAEVPSVPMRLALQTQAWNCGDAWETCPDRTTPSRVDMNVDWIAVYTPKA